MKTAMGEVSESFQGSSMQDAHDFAAQFIDNLKEGVMKMDKNKGRVNPVVDNLEMEWEETLLCERCGVKTVRRQKEVGLFCSLNEICPRLTFVNLLSRLLSQKLYIGTVR